MLLLCVLIRKTLPQLYLRWLLVQAAVTREDIRHEIAKKCLAISTRKLIIIIIFFLSLDYVICVISIFDKLLYKSLKFSTE